jgi:PAS domain S-box-containing protein
MVLDGSGAIVYANATALDIFGLSFDQLTGHVSVGAGLRVTHKDGSEMREWDSPVNVVLRTGQPLYDVTVGVALPGRQWRWLHADAIPVFDSEHTVRQVVGTFRDVTAQTLADEARRASESRFRGLFERAPIGLVRVDTGGNILAANTAAQEILGYDERELQHLCYLDLTHPDDLAPDRILFQEVLSGTRDSYSMEMRYRHKDGHIVWGHLAVSVTRDEQGNPASIIGMLLDLTERHEAEERLRNSEERYRQAGLALEQARAAAEELAALRQQQAEEAEAMATVGAALASALDAATIYQVILEQAARILPFDHAVIALYQDGWVISGATLGGPDIAPGTRLVPIDPTTRTWPRLSSGQPVHLPDTAAVPDWKDPAPWRGPYRVRSMIVVPLLIEGELIGSFQVNSYTPNFYTAQHIPIARAFSERATQAVRNARLYAAEQQRSRAAEDLARLRSDFVAAVSHELRTPLTAIIGFGELLIARWDQFSEERRLHRIGQMVQASNRQLRMVEDLLLLSQFEASRFRLQNTAGPLSALVRQAADEVQVSYPGQRIDLGGPDDLRVFADASRVVQVLVNMLDNAAKYSPDGSTVALSWERAGDLAMIRVYDHGPGIPAVGRDVLFTRFGRVPGSRTRAGRVGTGLGLFLARQLAEAMGGDLDLEHTGPAGSIFRLRLPAAQ